MLHEQLWRPETLVCTCVAVTVHCGLWLWDLDQHHAHIQPQRLGLVTGGGKTLEPRALVTQGSAGWGALADVGGGEGRRQLQMHKPLDTSEKQSAEGPQPLCGPLVFSVVAFAGVFCAAVHAGVYDRLLRDEMCRRSTARTRAARSSVVQAAGVLCRAGPWELQSLRHGMDTGSP